MTTGTGTRRPGHSRRQASVDYPKYAPLTYNTQQPPLHQFQPDMLAQPIIPSDYESDNQGYNSDLPLPHQHTHYHTNSKPPILNKEQLNLTVLQKWNPAISSILWIAPYATIYEFASSTNEWQKSGLVGTLFICQLTPGEFGEDRYHAIVLNRSGLDNFEAELRQTERGGVAMQGDFIEIVREDPEVGETKVNAIYVYSEPGTSTESSRLDCGGLMVKLADAAKLSREYAEVQAQGLAQMQISQPEPQIYQEPEPEPEPEPQRVAYVPTHPSPAPQIAPTPRQPVDLLALLRSGSVAPPSDVESVASRPPDPPPPTSHGSHLLDLLRNSGA